MEYHVVAVSDLGEVTGSEKLAIGGAQGEKTPDRTLLEVDGDWFGRKASRVEEDGEQDEYLGAVFCRVHAK